jgi:hypothetical protein
VELGSSAFWYKFDAKSYERTSCSKSSLDKLCSQSYAILLVSFYHSSMLQLLLYDQDKISAFARQSCFLNEIDQLSCPRSKGRNYKCNYLTAMAMLTTDAPRAGA